MAVIKVAGVKDVLKEIRQIDPELRKQFARDAKKIAAPIMDIAKASYPVTALSGMRYSWTQNKRQLLPWNSTMAKRGVQLKVDTSKRRQSVITIVQKNPAAAIIEFAGNSTKFGRSLSTLAWGAPGRVMWKAADGRTDKVQAEIRDLVDQVATNINRKLVY